MENKRELFLNLTASYFDNEIIYEIYSTDSFSICNVSNQAYVLFMYPNNDFSARLFKDSGVCGIIIDREHVRSIVENKSFVNKILRCDKKTFDSRAIYLNADNYTWFRDLKEKNDLNGPSSEIDYEMEKQIMSQGMCR